ncbi:MAG: hypothetical protein KC417_14310, partial [Myxococcales bacterium]|nr:hypothetical protein [Myxococcales bacterium]
SGGPGVRPPGSGPCLYGAACDPTNVSIDPLPDGGFGDAETEGLTIDPDGYITLNTGAAAQRSLWVANHARATVQRFDSVSGETVGIYMTGDDSNKLLVGGVLPAGLRDPTADGWFCGNPVDSGSGAGGPCPSRTALDLDYNLYIANMGMGEPGLQRIGSVTKIANRIEDCVDKNGSGVIDTSEDKNGNGVIDLDLDGDGIVDAYETAAETPPAYADWEFYATEDECILWTTVLDSWAPVLSGLSVGLDGDVWAISFTRKWAWRLNSTTGAIKEKLTGITPTSRPAGADSSFPSSFSSDALRRLSNLDGWTQWGPSGAATGADGRIWIVSADRFDDTYRSVLGYITPNSSGTGSTYTTATSAPHNLTPVNLIAIKHPTDPVANPGGQVFVTSLAGPYNGVARYNVDADSWSFKRLPKIERRSADLVNVPSSTALPPVQSVGPLVFTSTTSPVPTPAAGTASLWNNIAAPSGGLGAGYCPGTWTTSVSCGAQSTAAALPAPPNYTQNVTSAGCWVLFGTCTPAALGIGSFTAPPSIPAAGSGPSGSTTWCGTYGHCGPPTTCGANWSASAVSCGGAWAAGGGWYYRTCSVTFTPSCATTYQKSCTRTSVPSCSSFTCKQADDATTVPRYTTPCTYDSGTNMLQCGTAVVNVPGVGPVDHVNCKDNRWSTQWQIFPPQFWYYDGGPWQPGATGIAIAPDPDPMVTDMRVLLNVSGECGGAGQTRPLWYQLPSGNAAPVPTDIPAGDFQGYLCLEQAGNSMPSNGVFELKASDLSYIKYTPIPSAAGGVIGRGIAYVPALDGGYGKYWLVDSRQSFRFRSWWVDPTLMPYLLGLDTRVPNYGGWIIGSRIHSPESQSDFTGFALESLVERGRISIIMEGCDVPGLVSQWKALDMTADIPAGASLEFTARTAKTLAELSSATWSDPWVVTDVSEIPVDLTTSPGLLLPDLYMEVRVEFVRGTGSPRVKDFRADFTCAEPQD